MNEILRQIGQLPVAALLGAAALCALCALLVLLDELSPWK